MEKVLGDVDKVIIDQPSAGGQGVVPYLPLDQLRRDRPAASGNAGNAASGTNATGSAASATTTTSQGTN